MNDTVTKIASIFAEATADTVFDETQISESEKIDKAIKTVKCALDKAHTGAKILWEVNLLYKVLSNYSCEEAISLLDERIKKYEQFINATRPLTGRWVEHKSDPYADKTDEHIQIDVKFIIFIVYLASITEESTKVVVSKALNGMFGIFKENESEVLKNGFINRKSKRNTQGIG